MLSLWGANQCQLAHDPKYTAASAKEWTFSFGLDSQFSISLILDISGYLSLFPVPVVALSLWVCGLSLHLKVHTCKEALCPQWRSTLHLVQVLVTCYCSSNTCNSWYQTRAKWSGTCPFAQLCQTSPIYLLHCAGYIHVLLSHITIGLIEKCGSFSRRSVLSKQTLPLLSLLPLWIPDRIPWFSSPNFTVLRLEDSD